MTRESDRPDFHRTEGQTSGVSGEHSTADVVKEQAGQLGGVSAESGREVAGTAKEETKKVAAEAATQVRGLLDQARTEVTDQAGAQQQRAARSLRSVSDELRSMADSAERPGMVTDLAREASQRTDAFAQWLEEHEPGDLVVTAKSFARERPGMFLAIAAGAGVLAGRLTRGLKEGPTGSARSVPPSPTSRPEPLLASDAPAEAPQEPLDPYLSQPAGTYQGRGPL